MRYMLEPAALEVLLELASNIRRQFHALGSRLGLEPGVLPSTIRCHMEAPDGWGSGIASQWTPNALTE